MDKRENFFTSEDRYLFHQGTLYRAFRHMGAHPGDKDGVKGTYFVLWAPAAKEVSVLTEGNGYTPGRDMMENTGDGIWEIFLPGAGPGTSYRYAVKGADDVLRFKSDPYAYASELRPANASVVTGFSGYDWQDTEYMAKAGNKDIYEKPMAIYEAHLGSWKRSGDGFLTYRQLADELAEYLTYMGYTHIELMGICEYPFDGSWGYQVTGFFSPTARYGSPDDFRYFVDRLHRAGIGVILDWVPAHFPKDSFGLENFDGTFLYEHEDPLRREYPEWGTLAFDHGKPEVQSFLISSAFYWIEEFHIDALRVDAVASMLYNSFGRKEWRPNAGGGQENDESIAFLKKLNTVLADMTPGYMIAEDSSILPGITTPCRDGGFGFSFKWNMGWMNDTLKYIKKDPLFRGWHHEELAHISDYAFLEHYINVLSHDEVVHLKHSMLEKFPGSLADKLGGLKTLYTFMFTLPGKKLLFMGQEFAEDREWDENREINWSLASDSGHRDVMMSLRRLLEIYRTYPCLYTDALNSTTFEWISRSDAMRSTFSYIRRNPWNYDGALLVILNFSPVRYDDYLAGAPVDGAYRKIFSTYDGLDKGDFKPDEGMLISEHGECDGYKYRLRYHLRPYESVIFEVPEA